MKEVIPEVEAILYMDLAELHSRMAKKYMKIPRKRVPYKIKAMGIEKGRVVDVGTGPGRFRISIVRAYSKIRFTWIDLSLTMVRVAREDASEFGLGGLIDFHRDISRVAICFLTFSGNGLSLGMNWGKKVLWNRFDPRTASPNAGLF